VGDSQGAAGEDERQEGGRGMTFKQTEPLLRNGLAPAAKGRGSGCRCLSSPFPGEEAAVIDIAETKP